MNQPKRKWHVPFDADLRWRTWGGEVILYHGASGDTHLLNLFAAEVIRRLQQQPADAETVVEHVAPTLGLEPGPETRRNVDHLLARLDELGVIAPADDAA